MERRLLRIQKETSIMVKTKGWRFKLAYNLSLAPLLTVCHHIYILQAAIYLLMGIIMFQPHRTVRKGEENIACKALSAAVSAQ